MNPSQRWFSYSHNLTWDSPTEIRLGTDNVAVIIGKRPHYVLLPMAEFNHLRDKWRLPDFN